MKVLVFGKTGQVSTELGFLSDTICLGRSEVDLRSPAACGEIIRTMKPDAVINAAAYTAVDKAEEEEDLATVINSDAPAEMATVCADLDIPFVHISTDYVFDGSLDRPYQITDSTNPLGAYGRSKLKGEIAILDAFADAVIVRTSWVFSAHGSNFLRTMLRLSSNRDHLKIVSDQWGGPTSARSIAHMAMNIITKAGTGPDQKGIFHFSGASDTTWADFAEAVFNAAKRSMTVEKIKTSQYPTPARRPLNSRLDCSRILESFGIERSDWRSDMMDVMKDLKGVDW